MTDRPVCEVSYDVTRGSDGIRPTVTPTGEARFVCTVLGVDEHGPAGEMHRRWAEHAGMGHGVRADRRRGEVTADLATWLLEQTAEDERRAQRAADDGAETWLVRDLTAQGYLEDEMAEHVATWDPARVLAECDAKRRIVDEHAERVTTAPIPAEGWREVRLGECKKCADWASETEDGTLSDAYPCTTLKLVALPYAHRPGYREEWKP